MSEEVALETAEFFQRAVLGMEQQLASFFSALGLQFCQVLNVTQNHKAGFLLKVFLLLLLFGLFVNYTLDSLLLRVCRSSPLGGKGPRGLMVIQGSQQL